MDKIPVILDTDIGTDIDDTWALAMLLNCPELDLRLITTVSGDTDYRAHLAAKFLQTADRTDIPIGIGLGNPEGSLNFQAEWLAGFDPIAYPGVIQPDGVNTLLEIVSKAEEPVTIISIGPATNIANALEKAPHIAKKCHFVGMYGSIYYGYNSTVGAELEANVQQDVPSFRRVLSAAWEKIIITPLDTCGRVMLEGSRYQQLFCSEDPILKALIENYRIWSKRVTWMDVDYQETRSSILFDTVAVYLAYSHDLVEITSMNLRVTDNGITVPDPMGEKVMVALNWRNLENFLDHLVERLGGTPPKN